MENRAFFEMKTFFLVFTPDFVEFRNEYLCFLIHTLEFKVLKFLYPPNFVYASQSRYPGAGPGWLSKLKTFYVFFVLFSFHCNLGEKSALSSVKTFF